MMDETETLVQLRTQLEAIKKVSMHDIDTLIAGYEHMLHLLFPYKIGDKVVLKRTPSISPDSGWYRSRHFLVKGEECIVRKVGFNCHHNEIVVHVEFPSESWLNERTGEYIPSDRKHQFGFKHTDFTEDFDVNEDGSVNVLCNDITIDLDKVDSAHLKEYLLTLRVKR